MNDTKPPEAQSQAPSVVKELLSKPSAVSQVVEALAQVQ